MLITKVRIARQTHNSAFFSPIAISKFRIFPLRIENRIHISILIKNVFKKKSKLRDLNSKDVKLLYSFAAAFKIVVTEGIKQGTSFTQGTNVHL